MFYLLTGITAFLGLFTIAGIFAIKNMWLKISFVLVGLACIVYPIYLIFLLDDFIIISYPTPFLIIPVGIILYEVFSFGKNNSGHRLKTFRGGKNGIVADDSNNNTLSEIFPTVSEQQMDTSEVASVSIEDNESIIDQKDAPGDFIQQDISSSEVIEPLIHVKNNITKDSASTNVDSLKPKRVVDSKEFNVPINTKVDEPKKIDSTLPTIAPENKPKFNFPF